MLKSFRSNCVVATGMGAIAFVYYLILSAKEWTWVFVSYDSGDWLATANWWMVPQPYGSPLYITLCRFIGFLPGSQPTNITLLLSALPAAITVGLVYLIVLRLTDKRLLAVISSIVLLASTVFLTQATVVEEYTLATMFLTLGIYFRQRDNYKLTALCLGLGSAVHVLVLLIGVFWLAAEFKLWRKQLVSVGIAALTVAVSYSLIIVLMSMDTPRLLAGGLSYATLKNYVFAVGGSVVGQLSIFEFPLRLWDIGRVLLATLGLSIVPIIYALKYQMPKLRLVLLATIFVCIGYYLTCLDYTTWTFLTFTIPSLAILAGVGLNKLQPYHTKLVLASSIILILLNGIFMNASVLTKETPVAQQYYDKLTELPEGSIVATHAGSYSLGMFYALSKGVQVVPLVYPYLDWWEFEDYRLWLYSTYDVYIPPNIDTAQAIQYLLDDGKEVYFAHYPNSVTELQEKLVLEGTGDVRKVVEVR